jgi:uncharacterized protein
MTPTRPPAHIPDPARPPRGPVRRYLETRGLVGGHDRPHVHVRLRTQDNVRLAATFLPGPGPDAPAVVMAHGFAAHRRKPAYALLADHLADHAHVLSIDLRGHGSSTGQSTLGDREAFDVEAAVAWLRARGHDRVAALGASMGGTSLLHALARGVEVQAAVAVSAPAVLVRDPTTPPMDRMRRIWESSAARAGMRWGIGVNVVPPDQWRHPGDPQDFAADATAPLLVVHGQDDAWFPADDAVRIADAAPRSTLWLEPTGFGHAEDGFCPGFADRVGRAVSAALDSGHFPRRDEVAVSRDGGFPSPNKVTS